MRALTIVECQPGLHECLVEFAILARFLASVRIIWHRDKCVDLRIAFDLKRGVEADPDVCAITPAMAPTLIVFGMQA